MAFLKKYFPAPHPHDEGARAQAQKRRLRKAGWLRLGLALGLYCASASSFCVDLGLLKRECGQCHGVDVKIKGPSLKEIAARYKSDGNAERLLAERIRLGSAGRWGQTETMPPDPRISPLQARKLADWVLGF
jgi:cytochrome c